MRRRCVESISSAILTTRILSFTRPPSSSLLLISPSSSSSSYSTFNNNNKEQDRNRNRKKLPPPVVDLNLDWGNKVYRGNATEYAGVKVTSKLVWPIPLHALVQLNPELGAVLEVSKPTDEEAAEADRFLSVLRKSSSQSLLSSDAARNKEYDDDDDDDDGEESEDDDDKEDINKDDNELMNETEKTAKAKTENTATIAKKKKKNTKYATNIFPSTMPYAHLFENILLEAREHYPGGSNSQITKRQLTKSSLLVITKELLESVAEEMQVYIRPLPKENERKVLLYRKAQVRLNFLYSLTEHWRKQAKNGKELVTSKKTLAAAIWRKYLESVEQVRRENGEDFVTNLLVTTETNDEKEDEDDDVVVNREKRLEVKPVRTGGWAAGSQHRVKSYVDSLSEKNASSSQKKSSSRTNAAKTVVVVNDEKEEIVVEEEEKEKEEEVAERMNYPEIFSPEDLISILVKARAKDVMAMRVREKCSWANWLILCSGKSPRHITDLAQAVMSEYKKRAALNPKTNKVVKPYIEGAKADRSGSGDEEWNAVDCGSCVVHVMSDRARNHYNIEELWADGTEKKHNGAEILTIETIK